MLFAFRRRLDARLKPNERADASVLSGSNSSSLEAVPVEAIVLYRTSTEAAARAAGVSGAVALADAGIFVVQEWDVSAVDRALDQGIVARDADMGGQEAIASGEDVRIALVERSGADASDLVSELEQLDFVEAAQPNYVMSIDSAAVNDPLYDEWQYALHDEAAGIDVEAALESPYAVIIASSNEDNALSTFSNWNETEVELAFPGSQILSSVSADAAGTFFSPALSLADGKDLVYCNDFSGLGSADGAYEVAVFDSEGQRVTDGRERAFTVTPVEDAIGGQPGLEIVYDSRPSRTMSTSRSESNGSSRTRSAARHGRRRITRSVSRARRPMFRERTRSRRSKRASLATTPRTGLRSA